MERTTKDLNLERLHTNVLYLGLVLNFIAPGILLSLGLFLRNQGVGARSIEGLDVLLWVLLAVSAGEVLAIYLLKKRFCLPRTYRRLRTKALQRSECL